LGKTGVRRARKGIEEVVQYALGHRTRIQVLVVLNEGPRTAAEISRIIDVPQKTLQNHLHRMLEDGSIEIEEEGQTGNRTQYRYQSAVRHEYSAEEFERMHPIERQMIVGGILHSGIAEVLAGFHAGRLAEPGAHVYWDWYNVDDQGRGDADALTHRYLRGLRTIEDESTDRTEASGAETTSMFLKFLFFERPRKRADRPHRSAAERTPRAALPPGSGRFRAAQRYFGWGDRHPWI
jgi:DNA-binding transcriptional ArsR family regulator